MEVELVILPPCCKRTVKDIKKIDYKKNVKLRAKRRERNRKREGEREREG